MNKWTKLADEKTLQKTIIALKSNNINAVAVVDVLDAKQKVLELIPKNSEVMTMTSVTLDAIGIPKEINESENYISVRKKLMSFNSKTPTPEMQKLGAAPEYAIGSVHAVTEDGKIVIASNTGSQLAAEVYGASHVIFVVGTQKIVKNLDEAMKRVFEHSLQLESERAKKAYGVKESAVNKLLIINKEINSFRINLVFVKQNLGF